jgi:hypothetical protein
MCVFLDWIAFVFCGKLRYGINAILCDEVMIKLNENIFSFLTSLLYFCYVLLCVCRSQWPRGIRRWSSAARLLRLWVQIPPGAWVFVVSVVCFHVEVSATDCSLVQRIPTDCGASLCVIKKPRTRGG